MNKRIRNLKNHLTDEQLNYVKANYKSIAMKEMARQLKIPYSRVQDTMMFFGLQPNSKRVRPENYQSIKKKEKYFDVDAYFEQFYF